MNDKDRNEGGPGNTRLDEFLDAIASDNPTPGGGSASAYAGSMAAALVVMVARLTAGKKKYRDAWEKAESCSREGLLLQQELSDLAREDSEAFEAVMVAIRMPKETDSQKKARSRALQEATRQAAEVPRQVVVRCRQILPLALDMAKEGNVNAVSDALVAGELAAAGLRGAVANVRINLGSLRDKAYCDEVEGELQATQLVADKLLREVREAAAQRL